MSGGTLQRVDVSLIDQTSRFGGGFTTRVDAYAVGAEEGLTEVHWIRILAMAAGDEWPDLEGLNPETIALPDAYSNVENGVGFLGGVTSRLDYWPVFRLPVDEACYDLLRRW